MGNTKLIVTPAPHIRSGDSTPAIMRDVVIALLPAAISAVYFFGAQAAVSMVCSVAGAVGGPNTSLRRSQKKPVTIGGTGALL